MTGILAQLSTHDIAQIRFASMFAVLIVSVATGYFASRYFGVSETFAKKVMNVVMVVFNWPIGFMVVWRLNLSFELIWLPIVAVGLLLSVTAISIVVFSVLKLDKKTRLTSILAGSLSNMGYTGGQFICYALFGLTALAMAQIYLMLWTPLVYLTFIPFLKFTQLRADKQQVKISPRDFLDMRILIVPAVIAALVLNLSGVKSPQFIDRLHIVDILIYLASGMSFFAIGLNVRVSRLRKYISLHFIVGMIKFILTPALAILFIWLISMLGFDLGEMAAKVIMVQSFTPAAVITVVMSNVFSLDSRLSSAIWVVNTAFFVAIIAPILFIVFT